MIATYAAALAVCAASLAIGQAALGLCGARRWSWLSPALGLALLCVVCWGTVRLPGGGSLSAAVSLLLGLASVAYLWRRLEDGGEALRAGAPVAILALLATALPFVAEGHFGILGTGFNPDMSQHLLAADRLAEGHASQLLRQGYPLGPHAIAVALHDGLGIGLVPAFTGLTVAVAALAPLTALTAFREQPPVLRVPAALVVGLAYLVASYFAQGAFKETVQALFFLAFVLALREASRDSDWRERPLRFIPAAVLAAGSVYAYSFPGLIWLLGAAVAWGALSSLGRLAPPLAPALGPAPIRAAALGLLLFAVLVAPEVGRMVDFHSFETFDPAGPGLGNLFGQVSPFEALGIWPTGDFRLAPGDGAVPVLVYYLGAAYAAILLLYGAAVCLRGRETALLSGLAAAALAFLAARIGGTPYTAAKALEIGAPLAALVIVLPLLRRPVAWLYMLAAGACALLALANAPIGPRSYSPALTGLRDDVGAGPTLVLASERLLGEEHGAPYIAWELRGGRVCIAAAGADLPAGVRYVVAESSPSRPPFAGLRLRRVARPYTLWEVASPHPGRAPCPLIAVRQARQATP